MAGSRMHHQPGGLVQHQQLIVFMHDVQRDVFGQRHGLVFDDDSDHQHLAAHDFFFRFGLLAIQRERAILDPLLQAFTRIGGK